MSQVSYMPMTIPMENLFDEKVRIVKLQGPLRSEVFQQVIFPKETHYLQEVETIYTDYLLVYRIEKIIYGDFADLHEGDEIEIYDRPAYDKEMVETSHTIGLSESPCILRRESEFEITGDRLILFLRPAEENGRPIWDEAGREGIEAEAKIFELLQNPAVMQQMVALDW